MDLKWLNLVKIIFIVCKTNNDNTNGQIIENKMLFLKKFSNRPPNYNVWGLNFLL